MNKDKINNIQLLGTLNNSDESGIIANANQVYDNVAQKSVEERITDLDNKIESGLADDEDLTSVDDGTGSKVLKFADRTYNPDNFSGKGYKILRKNIIGGKNILTQIMINQPNTIYVIQYDFTLGEDITIPANCILEFDGGSISASGNNDTITAANTGINAGLVKIFNTDITLSGTWNVSEAYPEWFGAKGDGVNDDATPIQKCLDFCKTVFIQNVCLNNYKIYKVSKTIITYKSICFDGNGSRLLLDNNSSDLVLLRIVDNAVTNATFGNPHYQVVNMDIDGLWNGYNGGIVSESTTQSGATLCRSNTIGISIEFWECNIKDIQIHHFYYGIKCASSNTYINACNHVAIRHCYYGLHLDYTGITNSGENFKMINSSIGNCVIAFYVYHWGLYFTNCSIDHNGYYTKESEVTESASVHGGVRMTNCWLERGTSMSNFTGAPFNFRSILMFVENTLIIDDAFSEYLITNQYDVFSTYCSFIGCTFECGDINHGIPRYIAPDSISLHVSDCQLGHYTTLILPQPQANLIKNGDLKSTDTSAFGPSGSGTMNIVEESGQKKLIVTPQLYHGIDLFIKIKPTKDLYLFFDVATTGNFYVNLMFFDKDNKLVNRVYGSSISTIFNSKKIHLPANTDYLIISLKLTGADKTLNYFKGLYCWEF